MRYVIVFILLVFAVVAGGCRTGSDKRIAKDIIGINEQLYELEKGQLKNTNLIQELKGKADVKQVQPAPPKEEDKKISEEGLNKIYQEGYRNYLEEKYPESIRLLSQLTRPYESSPLADNALYWQAEAYFKLNDMDKALHYYQLVYRYFPFSNKADYALYKIGTIYFNANNFANASLAFNRLIKEYPESDLYKAALIKLGQIKPPNRRQK